ncbi:hypothetical protein KA005_08360, partial [bacterium]|nr:hypothetical protein [bacterium]
LTKGHLKDYLMANYDVVRSLPRIMEKRTSSLRVKCIADYDLLTSGDFVSSQFISLNTFQRFIVSIANKSFDSYWNLVKRFLYRPFSNRLFKTS